MSPTISRQAAAGVVAPPSFMRIQNAASIGDQAARGAFWNILFSVLNKLVAFGGQIALAWFLLPEDMGLAGIALAVTSIVSIASGTIPTILLIQHEGSFEENAGEIFWFSLTANFAAALLLVSVSPWAGQLFNDSRMAPIILILAMTLPLMALPTIYASHLYKDLRFRALAQIRFGEGLIRSIGSVILAALGFGACSLVLPQPVGAVYTAVRCHRLAGEIPLGRPHPRRWPALLAPALWLVALAGVNALQANGIIFVIGVMHDPTAAGFYSWGFALSSQAIFLLGTNLQSVFFPVLSKLNHDSSRQIEAFRRACTVLILVIVPVCALQIVLARPAIELLFRDRWLPAVPVVQWLSMGMMTQPLGILGTSLLLARGQYRLLAGLAGALTILNMAAAIIGAYFGREAEIARCTGITLFFTHLVIGWAACRELKCTAGYFYRKLLPPVFIALPLLGAGALLAFLTGGCPPFISILATGTMLLAFYGAGIWLLAPRLARDLAARLSLFPMN